MIGATTVMLTSHTLPKKITSKLKNAARLSALFFCAMQTIFNLKMVDQLYRIALKLIIDVAIGSVGSTIL